MKKTIGILGFGIVGRSYFDCYLKHKDSLLQFLFDQQEVDVVLVVWDRKCLALADILFLEQQGVVVYDALFVTMREFVGLCDYVLVSPGVDVAKISCKQKLISELDLFAHFFKGKTIGITGTLGKTTVTGFTATLLSRCRKSLVPAIGNIGDALLYVLDQQPDLTVMELSSFQLELSNVFAPDVAVLTNIYPNHLDRHLSMSAYFQAKWQLFVRQQEHQIAILPLSLFNGPLAAHAQQNLNELKSALIIVTPDNPTTLPVQRENYKLVYVKDMRVMIVLIVNGVMQDEQELMLLADLPETTFIENWLMILAITYACEQTVTKSNLTSLSLTQHHRLERIATINSVDFYNDSKATVMEATQAAVNKLAQQKKPLIVILGGLGKGVDRSGLVQSFSQNLCIKKIYAFGGERVTFGVADVYQTLDQVIDDIFLTMEPGDQVLFSPSGASFDLFNNYQHRGDIFKELVLKRAAQLDL